MGSDYLAQKYLYIADPFQLAITAYALEVARHRQKDNAYVRLRSFNRTGTQHAARGTQSIYMGGGAGYIEHCRTDTVSYINEVHK